MISTIKHLSWGIFLLLFMAGCEQPKKNAIGYDHLITVVCDEENWAICEPALSKSLGKIYKTPRTEPLYTFQRIDADDLELNLHNKNLMVLSQLEVHSEVTGQVRAMLPDTTITRIRESRNGYFYGKHAYAQGQALVIVLGKSPGDLKRRLEVNETKIFNFIEQTMFERNTAFVYRSGEQFEMADKYFEEHGYYLRMMHDYVEIENSDEKSMVWLGRDHPYRWLSVSWTTPNDSVDVDEQLKTLLFDTYENRMGSVQINEDVFQVESIWLQQYAANRYYGLWEHKEEVKGGPFIAYGFYEPVADRLYLLSGIVHAPDKEKMPYIRQMETIFKTFSTERFNPKDA